MRSYKKIPQRADSRRKRRMILLFGLALLLSLSAGGIFLTRTCWHWMYQSSLFRINSVHITGCQRISKEEIRKLANVDIHSNILAIDVDKIGRALETHPWVKQAIVRKELPDRLYIRIVEKQPVAILQDNGLYYVDKEGVIIARTNLAENMDYPIITGLKKGELLSDSEKVVHLRELLPLLYAQKNVEDVLPARNISEIHIDPGMGLVLYTVDGHFPIRLGMGDIVKKFRRLEMVLYDLYLKEAYNSVSYVDCEYYNGKIMIRKTINLS
ncbi:MAG: FtsQ-type POTRA domain-containing protein [Deltaproteobacteria bacterium]|nr:FtsQ-type POTRA domain-containing protein [Deltaproteobacteria bacterium]